VDQVRDLDGLFGLPALNMADHMPDGRVASEELHLLPELFDPVLTKISNPHLDCRSKGLERMGLGDSHHGNLFPASSNPF
jgi:hypothetical protein